MDDYNQYGDEWKKEMMSFKKEELVAMIKRLLKKNTLFENQILENEISEDRNK